MINLKKSFNLLIAGNFRAIFVLCCLICISVLLMAIYLQYGIGLTPCALCIVQRVFFVLTGLTCLIGAIHNPQGKGRIVYYVTAIIFIAGGLAAAIRQLYLQTLPLEQLPACLPNLDYMLEVLPAFEILKLFFYGTAECAKLNWTLLGIGIPEWSFITFIGLLNLITYSVIKTFKKS